MKHKIKMLKSMPGVHDGEIYPVPFVEGEQYEIGPDLLQAFINCGAVTLTNHESAEDEQVEVEQNPVDAQDIEEEQTPEGDASAEEAAESETKAEGEAPENKALKAAPENKKKK